MRITTLLMLLGCVALLIAAFVTTDWLVSESSYLGKLHIGLLKVRPPSGEVVDWGDAIPAYLKVLRALGILGCVLTILALLLAAAKIGYRHKVGLAEIWITQITLVVMVVWFEAVKSHVRSYDKLIAGSSAGMGFTALVLAISLLWVGRYLREPAATTPLYNCLRCRAGLMWVGTYQRWWCGGCGHYL